MGRRGREEKSPHFAPGFKLEWDPLTIGYFDNFDNESLNKYKKKS
jgi:hypothetical protein